MSEPTILQIAGYLEDLALMYESGQLFCSDPTQRALELEFQAAFLRDVAHDISVLEQTVYYEDRIDIVNRRVIELAEKING